MFLNCVIEERSTRKEAERLCSSFCFTYTQKSMFSSLFLKTNARMKNMTLFLSLLLLPLAVKSQIKMPYNKETVTIAIEVVDSLTQKNIANVTFGHFSAQRCYTANDKGKLYITILKSYLNDTLYIDLQNYQPKSITFNALAKLKKLYLQPKPVQQQAQTSITADKTIVLNDFDWKETEHYVGLPNPLQPFPYLQIAQRFDNPNELLILTKIKIGHLFFYLPDHVANGPLLSMQSSMPTNPASEAQARPVIDRYIHIIISNAALSG